jgi:ankyrin repeat protein
MAQQNLSESSIRAGAPAAPKNAYKANPPPVAIPGARPRTDAVAPAERAASDLPPTEALFDAINRGDIVTARDAISRGADLDGTNLLGVTPLELSVDLGRNDISFLLLSLGARPRRRRVPKPRWRHGRKPWRPGSSQWLRQRSRVRPCSPGMAAQRCRRLAS